jgi:hypothetical protein
MLVASGGTLHALLETGVFQATIKAADLRSHSRFLVRRQWLQQYDAPRNARAMSGLQGCDPEHPVIGCPHVNDGGHQTPSFARKAYRDFLGSF